MRNDPGEWDGADRRSPDPWRIKIEERVDRIEKTVGCIKARGDEFERTYGHLLKETLEARAQRARLWAVASEELVKKGVWAALLVVAGSLLLASKEAIRNWLTS